VKWLNDTKQTIVGRRRIGGGTGAFGKNGLFSLWWGKKWQKATKVKKWGGGFKKRMKEGSKEEKKKGLLKILPTQHTKKRKDGETTKTLQEKSDPAK